MENYSGMFGSVNDDLRWFLDHSIIATDMGFVLNMKPSEFETKLRELIKNNGVENVDL